MNLKEKMHAIQKEILSINPNAKLIAVTKTWPPEKIHSLYDLGQRDFAENYVQELIEKKKDFEAKNIFDIRWHFIGHLQSNKIQKILDWIECIHSVDSLKLAQEIDKKSKKLNKKTKIFLQVNIDEEATKSGFDVSEIIETQSDILNLESLEVLGLMAIPNPEKNINGESFLKMKSLSEKLKFSKNLSMGMSDDWKLALHNGSTHIRIGSALFGKRASAHLG